MPSTTQLITALAAAAFTSVRADYGPAFSTGAVANNSFIREAQSTLILPDIPTNNEGDLSLWVGMGTSKGDLIQSIAENYGTGNWSVYAYTLISISDVAQEVDQAVGTTAVAGDYITMHYKYEDSTQNYTQTVLLNDVVVSTLTTSDGVAEGWGSAVECDESDCGTVPAHKWVNTTIILDVADAGYIDTLALGDGVTGDLLTSDDGKTWTVDTISIPEFTFGSSS